MTEVTINRSAPRSDEDEQPPLTQEGRLIFLRRQTAIIERKMETHKRIESPEERRRIGNNVWRILEDIETTNNAIKKRDILHRAGIGHDGDSTKRLYHYAINPTLPEKAQLERVEKLAKKVARYAVIARAAAEACKLDRDTFMPALVEGTRYSLLLDEWKLDRQQARTIAWNDIIEMLSIAAKGIADRYGLQNLFQEVTAAGFSQYYSDWRRTEKTNEHESIQLKARPALVDERDLPPRPGVYLGQIILQPRVPCELNFSLDGVDDEALEPTYQALVRQNLETGCIRAHAVVKLLVHLELLPYGGTGEIGPVFRLSPFTEFIADEDFDGYAKAKFRKRGILTPDPVRKGDRLAWYWGALANDIDVIKDHDGPLYFAAFDEHKAVEFSIYLRVSASFDDALAGDYAHTSHSGIPPGGSLIVSADAHAWEYLDFPMGDIGWERPFCSYVYDLFGHIEEIKRLNAQLTEPILTERTMLAAVERSLQAAPGKARLDRMLDTEAKEFAARAAVELKKFRDAEHIESQHLQGKLEHLNTLKKELAEEYRRDS